MPDVPQGNEAAQKDTPLRTKLFRNFKGIYTRATRTAIPDDYFYNLENIIPIGDENAHVVPNISSALVNFGGDIVYWAQSVNLNGAEYVVSFTQSGAVWFYNIGTGSSVKVNASTLLSGSGSQCDQWKNSIILFIDSTGYYSYDGVTFAKITGAGVPTAGNSIAVYANCVWIVNGRQLFVSGINDYAAPAWTAAAGAQVVNLVDPQIRGTVQRLKAQNGVLYLIANTGINAISDVFIPAGAVPPTPQFTNLNIQGIIGTDQPASVMSYDRLLMFASRYGIHSLYGVQAPKVSGDIDGTWQYLDFTQPISGGQVVVANILCSAFLLKRLNDPMFGSNTIVALWYQQSTTSPQTGATDTSDIWWFANFGAITFVVSGIKNNVPTLFCYIGNVLYQLFSDTTTAPPVKIQTKQWPMEDELARKECIRAGFEAFFFLYGSSLQMTLDSDNLSVKLPLVQNLATGAWINAAALQGQWVNSTAQVGSWIAPALFLLPVDAQGGFGRHVGLSLAANGYTFELHHFAMDYKIRDRWL